MGSLNTMWVPTPKLCPFPRIATVVSLDNPVDLSLVVNETIAKKEKKSYS